MENTWLAGNYLTAVFLKLQEFFVVSLQQLEMDIPRILACLFLIVVGWIIAVIIEGALRRFLEFSRFEQFLKEHGVDDALGKIRISTVIEKIVKYYIILVFIEAAVSMFPVWGISNYLLQVLIYLPVFVVGAAITLFGFLLGEYTKEKILECGKEKYLGTVGQVVKTAIIVIAVIVGMQTIGINTSLLNQIIITLVQAIALGVGGAIALAFGLGGQKEAESIIKKAKKIWE